jgi:hypothetical protein
MKGLTPDEHEIMAMLAYCMNLFTRNVVGDDITREGDINEFAQGIHVLQNMIMAQAAAREHPDLYRLLGERIV